MAATHDSTTRTIFILIAGTLPIATQQKSDQATTRTRDSLEIKSLQTDI